jgi:hypothetical protein
MENGTRRQRACCPSYNFHTERDVRPQFHGSNDCGHVSHPRRNIGTDNTVHKGHNFFAEDMDPKSLRHEFRFLDQKSGQASRGAPIDLCDMWPTPKDSEVSYHNEHNFITLYPGVCHNVRAQFLTDRRAMVPLEAGHSYHLDFYPSWATSHILWQLGRKWQVLRWRAWPFGKPTHAYDAKSSGSDPPWAAEVRVCSELYV